MSLPPYSQYAECGLTWLSRFPAHWLLTKTKHVCDFSTGWTPPTGNAAAYEGECLWANISDLGPRVVSDTAKTISPAAAIEHGIEQVPTGSLMFSFKLSIGQVSFAGRPMFTNEAIATFRESRSLSLAFAYYAFPVFLVQNAADNIYGAKLLNQALIRAATFPLPPVEEQQSIAAFLDRETAKIDALIAEQEKLIALLAEKRQATISHAVTKGLNPDAPMKDSGVPWLGEVPAHWKCVRLGSMFRKCKRQGFEEKQVLSVYRDYGVISKESRSDNFNKTPEDLSSYQLVLPNDLVVNKMKGWQGSLGVSRLEGITSPDYMVFSPTHFDSPDFLHLLLRSANMVTVYRSISNGIRPAQWRLEPDSFLALRAFMPPAEEQAAIASFCANGEAGLNALAEHSEVAVNLLRERRSALVSAAVTGQIDVRGMVDAEAA